MDYLCTQQKCDFTGAKNKTYNKNRFQKKTTVYVLFLTVHPKRGVVFTRKLVSTVVSKYFTDEDQQDVKFIVKIGCRQYQTPLALCKSIPWSTLKSIEVCDDHCTL